MGAKVVAARSPATRSPDTGARVNDVIITVQDEFIISSTPFDRVAVSSQATGIDAMPHGTRNAI